MAIFDLKTFLRTSGQGGSTLGSLGTAFGMPSCLINLGSEVLSLLPFPILESLRASTADSAARADDAIKAGFAYLGQKFGLLEYDTEDGTIRWVSNSSKNGLDVQDGAEVGTFESFLNAVGAAAGFAGKLYTNYENAVDRINASKECIQGYLDYLKASGGNSITTRAKDNIEYEFDRERADLDRTVAFKESAEQLVAKIDAEMKARLANPELEPKFYPEYGDIISGTDLQIASSINTALPEVFRLAFAPPISKSGKFVLSKDGLYYDSQTSGIIPALLELESRKSELDAPNLWRLDYDPNIGGRGNQIKLEDLKSYVQTILDPSIVDESPFLSNYYLKDELLINLIGQKNRRIYDLSSQVVEYQTSGLSQALISNLRQVMLSETSHYLNKINKRKKQIELAIKMPSIYGKRISYQPGKVPVNDFSYLEGIDFEFDVSKQRKLTFNQAEVSSVVLPLKPKYTQQVQSANKVQLDHLLLSNIGLGSIISDQTVVDGPVLTVNHTIAKEGLIALLNYLYVESDKDSGYFKLHNSSDLGNRLDPILVTKAVEDIFNLGAGIVYLKGITEQSSLDSSIPSGIGSFIKLPEKKEFQDLLYNQTGATIDTWVHLPGLNIDSYNFSVKFDLQKYYRLILANENINGGSSGDSVNGLIYGFTRDRRITLDSPASDFTLDNPLNSACLFLAKTTSTGTDVDFISKSADCVNSDGYYNIRVPIFQSSSLSSIGNEFVHIVTTFDPINNEIKVYCDANLLATSSYEQTFGVDPRIANLGIPSFKQPNSFEYNETTMANTGSDDLMSGPKLDSYFTPWIIGGGYTDGMGFMGSHGGARSGLEGYVGSTKFYSRPLTQSEIEENFEVNRSLFKNVNVPSSTPELISTEVYSPGVSTLSSTKYSVEVYNGSSWDNAYVFSASRQAIAVNGGPSSNANQFWTSGSYPTVHYLTFGTPKSTLVRISKIGSSITNPIIRPASRNLSYLLSSGKLILEMDQLDKLWITPDSTDLSNPLFISCDPPKPDIPDNCLYYGPGIHTVGSGVSSIAEGTTVYLDGGAYVKATFLLNGKDDISFIGPGIIAPPDGVTREALVAQFPGVGFSSVSGVFDAGYVAIKTNYFWDDYVNTGKSSAKNFIISGVTFVNYAFWSVVGINKIGNCKFYSPWVWSTDGPYIIPDRVTGQCEFRDSIVFNSDDCLVGVGYRVSSTPATATYDNLLLYAMANGPIALAYGPRYDPNKDYPVTITNIDAANYQLSSASIINSQALIKIYDESVSSLSATISASPYDWGLFNVTLSSIRFEGSSCIPFIKMGNLDDPFMTGSGISFGNYSGIIFKDISVSGYPGTLSSLIQGLNASNTVKHVQFTDVVINGASITEDNYRTYFTFDATTDPTLVDSDITFNTT